MKFTREIFLRRAITKFGSKYRYQFPDNFNCYSKITVICPEHGVSQQTVGNHLGKTSRGCGKCGMQEAGDKKRTTTEEFVKKAITVHGNTYDYSKTCYTGCGKRIKISCLRCGEFETTAQMHLDGRGCIKCTREKKRQEREKLFLVKSKEVHGDRYSYDLVDYKRNKDKVIIICPKHGEFKMLVHAHLRGQGCLKCGIQQRVDAARPTTEHFIKQSNEVHKNRYSYELVNYISAKNKVTITCPVHGEFQQTPNNHISGKQGCQKCTRRISPASQRWLDSLGIEEREYRIPGTRYVVDGYDPINKVCYEFLGNFWHGNPEIFNPEDLNPSIKRTYGELYKQTMERLEEIKSLGYKVVFKWEKPKGKKYADLGCPSPNPAPSGQENLAETINGAECASIRN